MGRLRRPSPDHGAGCGAQATVFPIYVSASQPSGEPILNQDGFTAYPVSVPVTIGRIEVDGLARISVGDPVGAIAGATWSTLSLGSFSDSGAGHLLVSGFLAGTDPQENYATVLYGMASGPVLVFQRGVTEAAGTSPAITFDGSGDLRINVAAQVAARAYLSAGLADCNSSSPNYDCEGIWAGSPTVGLTKIARAGDPAPFVTDVTYAFFGSDEGRNALAFNLYGHLAFLARLRGTTVTPANDTLSSTEARSGEWSSWRVRETQLRAEVYTES